MSSTATPRPLPTAVATENIPTPRRDLPLNTPTSAVAQEASATPSHDGYIEIPWGVGDAGNWFLYASTILTLTWIDPPPRCYQYDFVLSISPSEETVIGSDYDPSDGVFTEWQVPERLSEAGLEGRAYCESSLVVRSYGAGILYSGDSPPQGVCVLASGNIGAPDIFDKPSLSAEAFAYLIPGDFAPVLERTDEGWYRIDTSVAMLHDETGGAPASGWVSDRYGIKLLGPCDGIPLVDDP